MLRKKDSEKVLKELKKIITSQLLKDLKIGNGSPVDSVESVDIAQYEIDDENEDRDKIIVKKVYAFVRIWIRFTEDSATSENYQVSNNKAIEFIYNKESDEFEIETEDVLFYND